MERVKKNFSWLTLLGFVYIIFGSMTALMIHLYEKIKYASTLSREDLFGFSLIIFLGIVMLVGNINMRMRRFAGIIHTCFSGGFLIYGVASLPLAMSLSGRGWSILLDPPVLTSILMLIFGICFGVYVVKSKPTKVIPIFVVLVSIIATLSLFANWKKTITPISWELFNKTGVKKSYYETGELLYETPYRDGKVDGVFKHYYKSGRLKTESLYKDSEQVGARKHYDKK